jgi:dihydropteroate synthase
MRYPLRLISSSAGRSFARHLAEAGVDPYGIQIIEKKAEMLILRVDRVSAPAANIIKQQLLSIGGDAAVHREVITGSPALSSVHIIADRSRLAQLPAKLARQPFGLTDLGNGIERMLDAIEHPPGRISLARGEIDLAAGPIVAGVLNITPDSFSDGGAYLDPGRAFEKAVAMVEEGAGIIDIGAESTRPGAKGIDAGEELARLMPVLEKLARTVTIPISIDTRKATVAQAAIDAGAGIINDVSGLRHDPAMVRTALGTNAAVVVMHMQGTPESMQHDPRYGDPTSEIIAWLEERTGELVRAGIDPAKIVVDPGIGFGKRLGDNLRIIAEIGDFRGLAHPVMIGYSRKSFIGTVTGRKTSERLPGGLAALAKCLAGGVGIVRVHDVKETVDFIKVWNAIEQKGTGA